MSYNFLSVESCAESVTSRLDSSHGVSSASTDEIKSASSKIESQEHTYTVMKQTESSNQFDIKPCPYTTPSPLDHKKGDLSQISAQNIQNKFYEALNSKSKDIYSEDENLSSAKSNKRKVDSSTTEKLPAKKKRSNQKGYNLLPGIPSTSSTEFLGSPMIDLLF